MMTEGTTSRMTQQEFRKMKSDLAKQRRQAVDEVCRRAAPDGDSPAWARWCFSSLKAAPPPGSLAAWHDGLGGTSATPLPPAGSAGFQGELVFARGDMINLAVESAACGVPTAVLNMANASTPGGGFLGGSRAQEEQLCHRSDLYLRLRMAASRGAYPLQNGTALLTPQVTLRLGDRAAHYAPLAEPAHLAVVTAAARRYKSEAAALKGGAGALLDDLTATWRGVLEVTATQVSTPVLLLLLLPLGSS
jgi:hypothetical protein